MYNEVWCEEISCSRKLENYALLKESIEPSPYLMVNIQKSKRALLSQLICGVLPFEVEVGCYYGTHLDERICKLCNQGVETELHFLFECEKLKTDRQWLYNKQPKLLQYQNNI